MTGADDGVLWSEHEREVNRERAHAERIAALQQPSPRVARIQARRDVRIARAKSATYTDRVYSRCIAAAVITLIAGFFAVIGVQSWGPDTTAKPHNSVDQQMWHDCLARGKEAYYDRDGINCH